MSEPVSKWPFVGMGAMAAVLFLYAASVLFAPLWVVLVLVVVWLVASVIACRWWTPRPGWVPLVPLALVVGWFTVVLAGHAWLDWNA